jgi:hypothetical protein
MVSGVQSKEFSIMYYLSSIPRSGSTLLASLLGQRGDTYVSPTSSLGDTMGAVVWQFENNPATQASQCTEQELYRTLKGISESKYSDRSEPIIFDKGRMWPMPLIMETMGKVHGEPIKIVATVRPIAECIASFYSIDPIDIPIELWIKGSSLFAHLMMSYEALKAGYEKYPNQFCLIEYDDLVSNTQECLNRISDFLGVDHIPYAPEIKQVEENDNAWGIEDLHKLSPNISKTAMDTRGILGNALYELYQGGEFWNDKPEPERGNHPLDFALEAGLHGSFVKGKEILNELLKSEPNNARALFNLGIYEMMDGNLVRGHKYLDYGRGEDAYGNTNLPTKKPLWNGEENATVLLNLEGGLGDQIHCVRYAKNLADKGCRVIVSGSADLGEILHRAEGVSAYIYNDQAALAQFDFWIPAMSAPVYLDVEFSDVSGKPYLPTLGSGEKIGVKWSGNPKFEHQQHRWFDPQLMWDCVEGFDCISLQKDGVVEAEGMDTPSLETWLDTQKAISQCDLVITSCTSIAHLAGAMGVKTFIVTPIFPYYTWALPGDKTPHYDSVTLFRQIKHGCWKEPFWQLKKAIRSLKWKTDGETTRQFVEA